MRKVSVWGVIVLCFIVIYFILNIERNGHSVENLGYSKTDLSLPFM